MFKVKASDRFLLHSGEWRVDIEEQKLAVRNIAFKKYFKD